MRKMKGADVQFVVDLLNTWPDRRLTWEAVRDAVSAGLLKGEVAWTRQSLEAKPEIKTAWDAAKIPTAEGTPPTLPGQTDPEVQRLQAALDELQSQYDALMIRHRTLAYNATFLPGGANLLMDPLPDNTPVDGSRRGKSKAQRR